MNALRENLAASEIRKKHFEEALKAIRPSLVATLQKKSREAEAGYA